MKLISEYTSKSNDAHWKRLLLITLGFILQFVAIVIFVIVFIVLVISLSQIKSTESVYFDRAFRILIVSSVAVSSAFMGWRLLRGRRQMILFLRRFGFEGATKVVTFAIERSVGRTWRVVTLDDKRVSPVGVTRTLPISSAVIAVIFVLILVAGSIDLYSSGVRIDFDPTPELARIDTSNPGVLIQRAVAIYFVIMFIIAFLLFPMLFLGVLSIFLFSIPFAAWRAERLKKINVSKEGEIDEIVTMVARQSKGLFVPRFIVMSVESLIWQPTVMKLTLHASAVVVDVSIPSENLIWEIERLRSISYMNSVYVADRDSIETINSETISDQGIVTQWRNILSGHEVITYSQAPGDQNKFERSLRNRLRDCVAGRQ